MTHRALDYWIILCLLFFQGSSQTDDSSSQRTSSSVLAKEALIEIDYSNLSEDLKVCLPHHTSVLYGRPVVHLSLVFLFVCFFPSVVKRGLFLVLMFKLFYSE